jgi:DNA polymerase (family 10)
MTLFQEPNKDRFLSDCPSDDWACADECDVRSFSLVRQCDVRGLLHCHTDYAGGAHPLRSIAETARALELEYLGVTDKAKVHGVGAGLCLEGNADQRSEIKELNAESDDLVLLHGIEVEAVLDGSLPLPDHVLDGFDYVVATLNNGSDLDAAASTARALRVIMNPFVNILGHPCGDWMTRGSGVPLDLKTILNAAATAAVAVEIDANPEHVDLNWNNCYKAQELGVTLVIASDAHRAARLADYRHGVELGRQAGLCCRQILNTRPLDEVRAFFLRQS